MLKLIAVAIAFCYISSQVEGQATFNCAPLDFTGIKKCCNRPPKDYAAANDPILLACNPKKDKKLTQWVNDFVLNRVQVFKNQNQINLSNKPAKTLLCTVGLFINCLLNKTNLLLPNGMFNEKATFNYINQSTPSGDEWKEIVTDTVEAAEPFHTFMPKMLREGIMCPVPGAKKGTTIQANVTLGAAFLVQMFNMARFEQCPDPVDTPKCNTLAEKWMECIGSLWENLDIGEERIRLNLAKKRAARKEGTSFFKKLISLKKLRVKMLGY